VEGRLEEISGKLRPNFRHNETRLRRSTKNDIHERDEVEWDFDELQDRRRNLNTDRGRIMVPLDFAPVCVSSSNGGLSIP
jgi:hypothetical protein